LLALQFRVKSREDCKALDDYVRLCRRGGEASFQELARSAGLVSPFAPGALATLGLAPAV
jgi:oligoendopeptidase F